MRYLALLSTCLLAACNSYPHTDPPAAAIAETPAAPEPEPISLFNGHDLTGWIQRGGKAVYRVEDGCIVGATRPNQPNSFLCTQQSYDNFILELEFKPDPEVNSGVQFRSESRPDYHNGRVHGYQIEIDTTPRSWTGGLYEEGRRGWLAPLDRNPAAKAAFKPNDWNTFRLVADGNRMRTWLNGVPAADLQDSWNSTGFIALQVHDVGKREDELLIRFRNIRLTPITR